MAKNKIIGIASSVGLISTLLPPNTPTAIPFNAQAIEELKETTMMQF